jgi:hypothetical protein
MFGGAKYRATGRGFVLSRDSFTRVYRTYARSHIYPAMKLLFMMIVFGIFNESGTNWFVEMEPMWGRARGWSLGPEPGPEPGPPTAR